MAQDNILDLAARRSGVDLSPCAACPVRGLSICGVLDDEQIRRLSDITSEVTLAPGQALFYEQDAAEHLYVIKTGCARVYKLLADGRRMVTGFLFTSDLVGLAEAGIYAYSCEAVTGLALCRFPRAKLQTMFEQYPHMERRMLEIATNELAAAQDQMVLLGRKTAQEKLASFLYLLMLRIERHSGKGGSITVPMSRGDIADHLGLTTESVSRCFTQFRKIGLIKLDTAHSVTVLDRAKLTEMTGSEDDGFEPHSAAL